MQMAYFSSLVQGFSSILKGLKLTLKHAWQARKSRSLKLVTENDFFEKTSGHVTLQYPHQTIAVPDVGRYQLDCEIEDCIVCDKCAKICPVDCIEIEAIKSPELIRTTSDGSPVRLHAATFDIDMAKCCFCGLCTTVCPTECLTMNSEYDYSVQDVELLNFAFSNLSEKEAQEKRDLYNQFVAEKEASKSKAIEEKKLEASKTPGFKPTFRPVNPMVKKEEPEAFRPTMKSTSQSNSEVSKVNSDLVNEKKEAKKTFRPSLKPASKEPLNVESNTDQKSPLDLAKTGREKKVFRPSLKPISRQDGLEKLAPVEKMEKPMAKKVFKPTLKPNTTEEELKKKPSVEDVEKPETKKVFRPTLKPKSKE